MNALVFTTCQQSASKYCINLICIPLLHKYSYLSHYFLYMLCVQKTVLNILKVQNLFFKLNLPFVFPISTSVLSYLQDQFNSLYSVLGNGWQEFPFLFGMVLITIDTFIMLYCFLATMSCIISLSVDEHISQLLLVLFGYLFLVTYYFVLKN